MSMFDVHDTKIYFVEDNRRSSAEKLLENRKPGTFLVRGSSTNVGDLALSVREHERIGHYHIEVKSERGSTTYVIGSRPFPEIAELLTFYKIHYLNDVPLKCPVNEIERESSIETEPAETTNTRDIPRLARAVKQRIPNPYEPNALKLEIGDLLIVTKANVCGIWNGKRISESTVQEGHFPFNYVEFLTVEEEEQLKASEMIANLLK